MTDLAVAFHESGHATVALVRGIAIDRVAIAPSAYCRSLALMGDLEASDVLVVLCAGACAESKHLGRAVEMEGEDLDQALAVSALRTRDAQAEDVLGRYRALVAAAVVAHWPSIERVAAALQRKGTLRGKDLEALIARGGEPGMDQPSYCEREQQARVAAAAAADGRAVGGGPHGLPAGFKEFMGDIARTTRDFVNEKIAAAVQPLERRIVDLEARTYQGTWQAQTSYRAGALVTHDGSLWVARSDSAGVRPGSTHCWQLAARKGADGRPGRDAA